MASYGNMTLREREDKNKAKQQNEENSQVGSDGKESGRSGRTNPMPRKHHKASRAKYDEKGLDKETGLDLCDCLDDNCPGCWFECPKCGSRKCGHECRCLRRYKYEYIEIEGTNTVIKPKHK